MNKNQENKLTMAQNVDALLDNNTTIVATIPVFVTKAAALKTKIGEIQAKDQERGTALSGKAQDKYDAEEKVIDDTMTIAGALYAYGTDTAKNDLIDIGDISESFLRKIRDTQLTVEATTRHDAANAEIANLANYGITPATLTSFMTNINAFSTALGQRESAVAARGGATAALRNLFKELFAILFTIDGIMEQLKNSEAQFYTEYQLARVIRDLGQVSHVRTGLVSPTSTKNITHDSFTDTTVFILKNTGTVKIRFGTALDGTTPITGGVEVTGGTEVSKTALELGDPGNNYLNVTNNDATATGQYEVRW